MLGSDYVEQVCSVARTLEVIGERWTILIVRDALLGRHRFEEFIDSLGVTRTVLTHRLARLVDEGVLERRRYQERPERFEYHLTAKGRELSTVIGVLMHWGDRHYPHPDGPPRRLRHRDCGGTAVTALHCDRCGIPLDAEQIVTETRASAT